MAASMEHQCQIAVLSGESFAALGRLKESKLGISLTWQMDTTENTNKGWPFALRDWRKLRKFKIVLFDLFLVEHIFPCL